MRGRRGTCLAEEAATTPEQRREPSPRQPSAKEETSMYRTDIERVAEAGLSKCAFLEASPGAYLVAAILAGAYVAFGIGLICFLGAPLAATGSPVTRLVMGASFGIALTLVIFAGSELFTGNNMFGVVSALTGRVSWPRVLRLWL